MCFTYILRMYRELTGFNMPTAGDCTTPLVKNVRIIFDFLPALVNTPVLQLHSDLKLPVLVKVPVLVLYGNYWAQGKFEKVM